MQPFRLFLLLQFSKAHTHDHRIQLHLLCLLPYDELELAKILSIFPNPKYLIFLTNLQMQSRYAQLDLQQMYQLLFPLDALLLKLLLIILL